MISVNANSTSSTSTTWTSVAGDHTIKVVADSESVINESDETNNEAIRTITVKEKIVYHGGGGGAPPRDSDGDGISDIDEMLAGTDQNDPCDPNSECPACLAIRPSAPTPITTPTPEATPIVMPTPTITPMPTLTPTQTPTPKPWWKIPGFEVIFAILVSQQISFGTRNTQK